MAITCSGRFLTAVAMVLLGSSAVGFAADGEIVVNGSFEQPAHSGDGYIYSTDPSFSLPGWSVPTGGNQFFLEYGQPFGIARHSDGTQAVCLNGDGIGVSMEQTLNTVIGDDYKLSFALGEEHTGRPSPTVVTVDFGPLMQTFDLASAAGFATFTMNLKAVSAQTLLRFTDATPGSAPFDSPFIDAVSVVGSTGTTPVAVPLPAAAWPALVLLAGLGLIRLRRRLPG